MSVAEELLYSYENLRTQDANEAETRLKLIDRIIFEVLGSSLERLIKGQKTTCNPNPAKGFRRQHQGFGPPQKAGPKVIIF